LDPRRICSGFIAEKGEKNMFIYSEAEIRKADRQAEEKGLSITVLMENAGRSLYEAIRDKVSKTETIAVLSGTGNNGGDGIVLARYLQQNGYAASLLLPLGEPKTNAALEHFHYYKSCGYKAVNWDDQQQYDVIVDALLGIGTRPSLTGDVKEIVMWANKQQAKRIAVDIPTGVTADSGKVEEAFLADYTFCLHGMKYSMFSEAARYYGKTESLNIGLPHESKWRVWTDEDVKQTFLQRSVFSHKGTFGTGILLAGSDEMPGSALLAALGAMRSGIGKLTVGTTSFVASILAARLPEATYWFDGLEKTAAGEFPDKIQAAAIGPGIADEEAVERALQYLFVKPVPLVLDAGALKNRKYPKRPAVTVLTPHPGEFSRMTGRSVKEIQENRIAYASEYACQHQVVVVLKGRHTVIAFPDGSGFVNPTGNAGLAKGGSGDTLTGILLAFLCTYLDEKAAIANAVYVHGLCADVWKKEKAEASLIASDLSDLLPHVLKRFEN
jgi:hydroxyethylthiazole kinase-like uncharacterized protein yjeF